MYSVTQRISKVKQPRGGYINPKRLEVIEQPALGELAEAENIHTSLVGLAVDYLTRLENGAAVKEAFKISGSGAVKLSRVDDNAIGLCAGLMDQVKSGLSDETITAACKLSGFDCCFRAGLAVYRPVENINPDADTISNIRLMVNRSLAVIEAYGPVTMDGFTFPGGYTEMVSAGDGDFLTKDTLWDFKVSVKPPTNKHTLQLLIYWRMGLHSIHDEFNTIEYLGFFNPRLNTVYRIAVADIDEATITEVERDVICYE